MKRELNFRLGKGRLREMRKAHTPNALIDAMRLLGMTEEEIKQKLLQILSERNKEVV